MTSKSTISLAMAVILFTFQYLTQAATIDIEDGGSHIINHSAYQYDWVRVDNNIAYDPGTHIDLVDGGVVKELYFYNNSSLTMTGGHVGLILRGWQNSTLEISGGWMEDFYTLGNSTATMTGGTVHDELAAGFDSTITMSGGSFGNIRAYYDGKIYLIGSGFEVDGQPLSYGDKLSDYGTFYPVIPVGQGYYMNYYSGTITGTLADGSFVNNTFYVAADGTAEIFVTPEPATLALLGLGTLMLKRKFGKIYN
jgi:hypothetical protein